MLYLRFYHVPWNNTSPASRSNNHQLIDQICFALGISLDNKDGRRRDLVHISTEVVPNLQL